MPTFAWMSGNIVSQVIVADNKEDAEAALRCTLIEYTPENPAGIGWTYVDGKFVPPQPEETSDGEESE